jgi:hypothetical protein
MAARTIIRWRRCFFLHYTDQVGDDAEGRQGDNVDLGMAEKPEQMLEQYRASPL